jgi:uncharacterized protein YfaS (alpha-2-macroglobulin family)
MIHGDYLFGAPASGQKLSWSLLRAADPYRSKLVPDASFNVPGRDEWGWNSAPQQLLADGETKLDAQGNFTLTQPLKLPNPVGQREVLTISASVEDANGQAVSRLAQVELYAAKVVVGLVGGSYLAEKGKPHKVTAIALTPEDTASANTPVRVLTRESGWRSVRRAGPGGGYYWTSERVEKAEVVRCARVVLAYLDRTGTPQRLEAVGLFAVCIQHELDHLDGTLYVDRLPPLEQKLTLQDYERSRAEAAAQSPPP